MPKAPKDLNVWIEHGDSAYGASIAKEQEEPFKQAGVKVGVDVHSANAATPDVWMSTI